MSEPTAIFVYGTLMPEHLRWEMVAPHATSALAGRVPGLLYDTGLGWPAAVLDPGATTTVPGVVVGIRAEAAAALLSALDVVEDVASGLYERVLVEPRPGEVAWAWSYARTVEDMVAIDAWVDQPER